MIEIEAQLRRYGDALERSVEQPVEPTLGPSDAEPDPYPCPRHRTGGLIAAAATLVVLVIVAAVAGNTREPDEDLQATGPADHDQLFESATGTVLVLNDGIDGLTAVDLDTGLASRHMIDGERAGDQPYRMTLVNGELVVGWGEIYAVPLDGRLTTHLDTATIFVPAAEPDSVWTIDYPGGRVGAGRAQIRRVTTNGAIELSTDSLDTTAYQPVYGVPGGLAVIGQQGLAIWNAATGAVTAPVGPVPDSGQLTSNGTYLAWCEQMCASLGLVRLPTPGPATAPASASSQLVALSPDGSQLAMLRPSSTGLTDLVITDLAGGVETEIATGLEADASVQWTTDSQQLFYLKTSEPSSPATVGRYDVATHRWETVSLDLGPSIGFLPIPRPDANALMTGRRVEANECATAGDTYPSGRTEACTFDVTGRSSGP